MLDISQVGYALGLTTGNPPALWLDVAAALVGGTGAWLVIEIRRAWFTDRGPRQRRSRRRGEPTAAVEAVPVDDIAETLASMTRQLAELQSDVGVLRAEVARAAQLPDRRDAADEPMPPASFSAAAATIARQQALIDELSCWPTDRELERFEKERTVRRVREQLGMPPEPTRPT